ncbi:hypothetical protein DRQ12_03760 [candidate division KSB1 bacterium]|nr:MAG: hypothetical protein DRQ12_03760 [candidate division KSB1 bacterium]
MYLLVSKKTKWSYIGCTNNLENRLIEHRSGHVFSTKKEGLGENLGVWIGESNSLR